MRKKNQPGDKCVCFAIGIWSITIHGCFSANLAGVVVALTETGATATTSGSGVATFTGLMPGTYHATTTAPTGYNTGSATATIGAGTTNTTITLTPATGWSCTCNTCLPGNCDGGPPYPIVDEPDERYVTDSFGTVTMTRVGLSHYVGTATRPAAKAQPCPAIDEDCSTADVLEDVNVPVLFELVCEDLSVGCWDCRTGAENPACTAIESCVQEAYDSPPYSNDTYWADFEALPSVTEDTGCAPGSNTYSMATASPTSIDAGLPFYATYNVNFDRSGLGGHPRQKRMPYQIYGDTGSFIVSD